MDMKEYELSRGTTQYYMDIILSRREREELLMEWGESMSSIAASTRAATKAKFQRRQTVHNARKLAKLEKVFGFASRRFKSPLLSKKGADKTVDESTQPTVSDSSKTFRSTTQRTFSTLQGDDDNRSQIKDTESNDHANENVLSRGMTDDCGVDDEELVSDDFTLGATTLGNNSSFSPSINEIEKFYEELEFELFGDEVETPSMLGQTLEVPLDAQTNSNLSIMSGHTMFGDETLMNEEENPNQRYTYAERFQSALSINENRRFAHGYDVVRNSTEPQYDIPSTSAFSPIYQHGLSESYYQHNTFGLPRVGYNRSRSIPQGEYDGSGGSRYWEPATEDRCISLPRNEFTPQTLRYHQGSYETTHTEGSRYEDRINGSQNYIYNAKGSRNDIPFSEGRLQHYTHPQFQPSSCSSCPSWDSAYSPSRHSDPGGLYCPQSYHPQQTLESFRTSQDIDNDGPEVRHIPLPAHFSYHHLVDGINEERPVGNNASPTISESYSS